MKLMKLNVNSLNMSFFLQEKEFQGSCLWPSLTHFLRCSLSINGNQGFAAAAYWKWISRKATSSSSNNNYCYYYLQDNPNIFISTIIFCCVNWKDVTLFCTLDWLLCLSRTSRSSQEWHSGKFSVHKTFLGFGFWVLWVLEKCARQKCNVYHFYKDIAVRVKSCYEDHAHFDRDSFQKFFLSTL